MFITITEKLKGTEITASFIDPFTVQSPISEIFVGLRLKMFVEELKVTKLGPEPIIANV